MGTTTVAAGNGTSQQGGGGTIPAAGVQDSLAPSTVVAPSATAVNTGLAAKATLQTGALAASTTAAPNATAVQAAISAAVSSIVNGAPGSLDALNELAAALGNDANFATTVTNLIAAKQSALVNQVNVKSINGVSLLGAGDLVIAGGGGSTPTQRIAATTVIPLDTIDAGKAMPLVAGTTINITADITPTIAAGAVLDGVCTADYVSSGVGKLLLTNYNARGDTYAEEAGRKYTVVYYMRTSGAFAVVQKGDLIDATAPVIGAAHVEAAAKTIVAFPITELNTPSINGTTAGVTLSGAAASGRTVSAIAVVGSELRVTLSTALAYGDVLNIALATGMVKDAAGNLSAAYSAAAVTNNIVIAAPNAPTLAAGTATSSTQPLTITAGAVDGTHGAAATYQVYLSADGGTTYAASGSASASLTPTVTGLTASTSYKYKVRGINAGGTSTDSNVVTNSTAASSSLFADNFNRADGVLGSPWAAETSASYLNSVRVAGNKLTNASAPGPSCALVNIGATAFKATFDIALASSNQHLFAFRSAGAYPSALKLYFNGFSGQMSIVNESGAGVAGPTAASIPTNGTSAAIELICTAAGAITVKVNGVSQPELSVTQNFNPSTGTFIGFVSLAATDPTTIDNLVVTP